jgi:hypothetical protein
MEAVVITGAHAIIYSVKPDADRAFMRDILGLPSVDTGGGWLIFGLPPSEVAVHPAEENGRHELYFLVADVAAFIARMKRRKITCSALHTERWGLITNVTLPGGGTVGVYQPLHARPPAAPSPRASTTPRRAARPRARTSAPKRNKKRGGT